MKFRLWFRNMLGKDEVIQLWFRIMFVKDEDIS